jgi:hypothetical protein
MSVSKQGNEGDLCGCYLAFTMASTVFCSCELSCPDTVSTLLVTYVDAYVNKGTEKKAVPDVCNTHR